MNNYLKKKIYAALKQNGNEYEVFKFLFSTVTETMEIQFMEEQIFNWTMPILNDFMEKVNSFFYFIF